MNTVKRYSRFLAWFAASLLVAMAAGCGGGSEGRDPILGVGAGVAGPAPGAGGGAAGPASCAGPGPVDMGAAANFGVLVGPAGGATLTNNGLLTLVNGDVGAAVQTTAPAQGAGFNNYTGVDAPFVAAKAAMLAAIVCANGRACTANYGVATDFATVVGLAPGVHCVTGAMSVGSNLVLNNAGIYIFRSTAGLTSANNINVTFGAGVNATNTYLFWVPSGAASIGSGNAFLGTIMPDASAATTLGANTTLLPGRAFSNSDVTLSTNTITRPIP